VVGAAFCVAILPAARALHDTLARVGGGALLDMDDSYAVGPPSEVAFEAAAQCGRTLRQSLSLQLQEEKCQCYRRRDPGGLATDCHRLGAMPLCQVGSAARVASARGTSRLLGIWLQAALWLVASQALGCVQQQRAAIATTGTSENRAALRCRYRTQEPASMTVAIPCREATPDRACVSELRGSALIGLNWCRCTGLRTFLHHLNSYEDIMQNTV
jgi:hypothetical protein